MSIFLASPVVEVAIVAAGGHRTVGDVEHRLNFAAGSQAVINGLVDADAPRQAVGADALDHDLAANLHHVVLHMVPLQHLGHDIAAVALGNGRAVEHHARVGFPDLPTLQRHFTVADNLQQAVHLPVGRLDSVLEAKAPGIDQRRHRNVECTLGNVGDDHRLTEHLDKHTVERHRPVLVDGRDDRPLVERRERLVHALQAGTYVVHQVGVALVGDLIERSEHHPFVPLVRDIGLLADDEYRANDEQRQERQLPDEFSLTLGIHQMSMITLNVPSMRSLSQMP